jgi:ActR/RegA family two-component response regulator
MQHKSILSAFPTPIQRKQSFQPRQAEVILVSRGLFVDNHFEELEPLLAAAAFQHGHSLQCARSPQEALAILRNAPEPFGFIVMDTDFNDFSLLGLDALQAIHTAAPGANIVLLTGTDDADVRMAVECLRLGAIEYWSKQNLDTDRMIRDASRAAHFQDTRAKCSNSAPTIHRVAETCPALYTDQFLDTYRTTFALRLRAVGVPQGDSGDHRAWQKKMLCALLTPIVGRSLQLRYQILREQECGSEFQIWILGFGWGDDANEARRRSEHLWFDVALFLRIAEQLYTMETVTEEATLRNLLSSDSQGWCCWFEVLRGGRSVTFEPPRRVSDSPSSDLKQRLVVPFSLPENRSTLYMACDFMRHQDVPCVFVVNLRPSRLSGDLADYLGTLRRTIAAKWDVHTGPSVLSVVHPAGPGELEALATRLVVLQQDLSSHYDITCCAAAGSQLAGRALANLFANELFGPDPDVFELRTISHDRARAISGGSSEPALPWDLLVHKYALDDAQNLFRLPVPVKDVVPGVITTPERFAFVPEGLPDNGAVLGHKATARGSGKCAIHFTDRDRMQHLYALGQSGTGKSSLLFRLIRQDIEAGHGVGLIDPHGELAESVLSIIPDNRVDDVVLIEPADCAHPVGINILEWDRRNPAERSFINDEMLRIFDLIYDLRLTGGPMFEMYFRAAASLAMASPDHPASLGDVMRIFTDEGFRRTLLDRTTDADLVTFWTEMATHTSGDFSLAILLHTL